MAPRPQQQPPSPATPGLKVVEKREEVAVPVGQVAPAAQDHDAEAKTRQAEAAVRRRLHPPRVWPD